METAQVRSVVNTIRLGIAPFFAHKLPTSPFPLTLSSLSFLLSSLALLHPLLSRSLRYVVVPYTYFVVVLLLLAASLHRSSPFHLSFVSLCLLSFFFVSSFPNPLFLIQFSQTPSAAQPEQIVVPVLSCFVLTFRAIHFDYSLTPVIAPRRF